VYGGDATYGGSQGEVDQTVNPAVLTVTAQTTTVTYGGQMPPLTFTATGFVNGDTVASLATQPSCSSTVTQDGSDNDTSPVGAYPITCSGAEDANYAFDYVSGTLTVGPATLTITGQSATVTYGGQMPLLTFTTSGFVNGDTVASLATQPSCSSTATQDGSGNDTSPVGAYPITCSGAEDANYAFDYVSGTLTVGPATVTITGQSATVTYGGQMPSLTFAASGFVNGDTVASLATQPSCSTTATQDGSGQDTSPVGAYPITCSGAEDANYAFDYVSGTLNVGPAALTITGQSATVTYGGQMPPLRFAVSGFVNGDTVASLATQPSCSSTATQDGSGNDTSPVGAYPITCSGAEDANYAFSYVSGTLTVGPATLRITGQSAIVTYGGQMPSLTFAASGLVNGDTVASLATQPSCSTTATQDASGYDTSPVGAYPITCSGAEDTNYSFDYVSGTLTVGRAALTITAGSATVSYGAAIPPIGPGYTGLQNGDPAPSKPPSCFTSAIAGADAGSYATTCARAHDRNYAITYVSGTLSIHPIGSTTTLSSNSLGNTSGLKQPVTLTARVTSSYGAPKGSVTFLDGSSPLTSVSLRGGRATYMTSNLSIGTHNLIAAYSATKNSRGGVNFSKSASPATTQTVIQILTTIVDDTQYHGGSTGDNDIAAASSQHVKAVVVHFTWRAIEATYGRFNWTLPDRQIAHADGKPIVLALSFQAGWGPPGGSCRRRGDKSPQSGANYWNELPNWVLNPQNPGRPNVSTSQMPWECDGNGLRVPDYFSSTFINDWEGFVSAVAKRYSSHRVLYVRVATGLGDEGIYWLGSSSAKMAFNRTIGYTPAKWASWQEQMLTAYRSAFGSIPVLYPINQQDNNVQVQVAEWAVNNGFGLGQNGLMPSWQNPASSYADMRQILAYVSASGRHPIVELQTYAAESYGLSPSAAISRMTADINYAMASGAVTTLELYPDDIDFGSSNSTFDSLLGEIS
jgi:hypothetical protein